MSQRRDLRPEPGHDRNFDAAPDRHGAAPTGWP